MMIRDESIVGDPIICKRENPPYANYTYGDLLDNKRCPNASTCDIQCPGREGFEKPAARWVKLGCSPI